MPSLDDALNEVREAVADLHRQGWEHSDSGLQRLLDHVDSEPLAGLIEATVPPFDYDAWLDSCGAKGRNVDGKLRMPTWRPSRVAWRIAICRTTVASRLESRGFAEFLLPFYGYEGDLADRFERFLGIAVDPLEDELRTLAATRLSAPAFTQSIARGFEPTGNTRLDALLAAALEKFGGLDPAVRKDGLDKLWDAWECLKTIDSGDKPAGMKRHLDSAAGNPPALRERLEAEATALTKIGNDFFVRHSETTKPTVGGSAQVDYLFYRMFAMMWLILNTRREEAP